MRPRWKTCAARRGLAAQVLRPENKLFVPAAINLSHLHISSWFATEQPLLDGEPATGTSGWQRQGRGHPSSCPSHGEVEKGWHY